MYPILTIMIRTLARDNYGSESYLFSENLWTWPDNVAELEATANRFDYEEVTEFAVGEDTSRVALVEKYGAQDLDTFLESVFQGDLHDEFFTDTYNEQTAS